MLTDTLWLLMVAGWLVNHARDLICSMLNFEPIDLFSFFGL